MVVFITAFFATIIVFVSMDGENIQRMFLRELNRRTTTEVHADEIQFTVLRNFPMASLRLSNVYVADKINPDNNNLLAHAASVHLSFNILDFFRSEYTIKHLAVDQGFFYPTVYEDGQKNYVFWKQDTVKSNEGLNFDIDRIDLKDLEVKYLYQPTNQLVDVYLTDIGLALSRNAEKLAIRTGGQLQATKIHAGRVHLDEQIEAEANLMLAVDSLGGLFIENSRLQLNGHHFIIDGYVDREEHSLYADASISARNISGSQLLNDLPVAWQVKARPYGLDGVYDIDADIRGYLDNQKTIELNASFSLREGHIKLPKQAISTDIHQMQGQYSKQEGMNFSEGELIISRIQASGDDSRMQGAIRVENLQAPRLTFDISASMPAGKILSFYPHNTLHNPRGNINMDIQFAGTMSEGWSFSRTDLLASELSGEVILQGVSFSLDERNHLPYRDIEARLSFRDKHLEMKNVSGKVGNSDFSLKGNMSNMLPYLFLPGETAFVQTDFYSSYIDMDEILRQHTSETDTIYKLQLPSRLNMQMQATVNNFKFRDFTAEDITGNARIAEQQFFADHLELKAMDGKASLEGVIDGRYGNDLRISCRTSLSDVDIHELFLQTGNFGQHAIRHDHIHGRVTADMEFTALWSNDLTIDWNSMETTANIIIREGRLVNYYPLIALGKHIRTSDLSDVSFSTLENDIHIKNREILIPQMEIASSALDLQLSGKHTFDNEIDYRLQVLLSDILAREHRERRNPQEQYGEIIDDGTGGTTLFLKLTGDVHNPQFRYDYQGVREKLRDDLRQERNNLRQILRDEFRFLSRDSDDEPAIDTQEGEQQRKHERDGFWIEWDEMP